MRYRRGVDSFPRIVGMLLLLYVVFQLAVGMALLLKGMLLVAAIVLLIGPIVGLLVADAVLLYVRVTHSLRSVQEELNFSRFFT